MLTLLIVVFLGLLIRNWFMHVNTQTSQQAQPHQQRQPPQQIYGQPPQPAQTVENFASTFLSQLTGSASTTTRNRKKAQVPVDRAPIMDNFSSLPDVVRALRKNGLESSSLVVAVDFTLSNLEQGANTFGRKSLHTIDPTHQKMNPYQEVISIMGQTLESFDDDKLIPAFGFGDVTTKAKSCFPFFPDHPARGFQEVLTRYTELAQQVQLSGPTNFAPVIYQAMNLCKATREYHILLIIADGQVTNEQQTVDAIVAACDYPLSIVMVGVGDGPWAQMQEFDDRLPERKWDNFQFVDFHSIMTTTRPELQAATFAMKALMEIPEQYSKLKQMDMIE